MWFLDDFCGRSALNIYVFLTRGDALFWALSGVLCFSGVEVVAVLLHAKGVFIYHNIRLNHSLMSYPRRFSDRLEFIKATWLYLYFSIFTARACRMLPLLLIFGGLE